MIGCDSARRASRRGWKSVAAMKAECLLLQHVERRGLALRRLRLASGLQLQGDETGAQANRQSKQTRISLSVCTTRLYLSDNSIISIHFTCFACLPVYALSLLQFLRPGKTYKQADACSRMPMSRICAGENISAPSGDAHVTERFGETVNLNWYAPACV